MRRALAHRYALRIALVALALALLAFGLRGNGAALRPPRPLPRAVLRGPAVTLATLRGHPAVIVFFASWCTGCHAEAAAVERFARSRAGDGHIVAIDDLDPVATDARAFLAQYHWTLPVLRDADGRTGDAYGVTSLPATVVLNAKGLIVRRLLGPQSVASLERALRTAARSRA